MKKFLKQSVLFAALAAVFACSGSGDDIFALDKVKSGAVVVTVNGLEIHEGLLNTLAELSPRLKTQLDNPLTRKKILGSLVEQQLLYQEAVKKGLVNDEDVKLKMLLNKHTIISNALLEKSLDDAMKTAYEERKDSQFTKLNISQIAFNFVSEEDAKKGVKPTDAQKKQAQDKANAAKARLDKGDDFAAVAKETSDDKRTSTKGGDAGQISKDDKRYARLGLKEIPEKAFALKKDQVSDPIETASGYYIVKVTSDPIITDFEEAKRVLGFEMQTTVKTKLVDDLKKNSTVVYADEASNPPTAATAEKDPEMKKPAPQNAPAPAPVPDATPDAKTTAEVKGQNH